MPELSFLTAFIGGVLALLTPCSALLVPAFFSAIVSANRRRTRPAATNVLLHGVVFYVGLLVTLVPLGLGIGLFSGVLHTHWTPIVAVASALLILFGIMQLLGTGFDLGRLVPGMSRVDAKLAEMTGPVRSFVLGAASGIAGFCAGPILGAILTLAFTLDSPVRAGWLMATYGAGMVVPLVGIAMVWGSASDAFRRRIVATRAVRVGKWKLPWVNLLAGVLLIVVGIVFWATNGLVNATTLVPISWLTDAQQWVTVHTVSLQMCSVVVVAAGLLLWWHFRCYRRENPVQHRVRIDVDSLPQQPDLGAI